MSRITLGEKGSVYILVNGSFPHLVKIGSTTLDPHERARQLTASTASLTPFFVAYHKSTKDVNASESAAHEILRDYRVNEGREFFNCSLDVAIKAVDRACGAAVVLPDLSFAELFNSFPDDGSARELNEEERTACRKLKEKIE